jgi:hypothetical protein
MGARRLAYWLLVLWPALLLGSIGLQARFGAVPFVLPSSLEVQRERLSAYADILEETRAVLAKKSRDGDVLELAAMDWIQQARDGVLQPLYPSLAGDTIRNGVKNEIFDARRDLASRLANSSARHAEKNPRLAALRIMLAIELSEIVKYADFDAVAVTAEDERRFLKLLENILPRLPVEEQRVLRTSLAKIFDLQRPLGSLMALAYRQFEEGERRPSNRVEPVARINKEMTSYLRGDRSIARGIKALDICLKFAPPEIATGFIGSVKVAFATQRRFLGDLAKVAGIALPTSKSGMLARN